MWNIVAIIFMAGSCKLLYDIFSDDDDHQENLSRGEAECHRVMKELLPDDKFVKARPEFLNKLELDLYCEPLKLAVEYNGSQHYEYNNIFHKSEEDFIQQQKRDELKRKLCKDNGVRLITVSYKVRNIEEYIRHKLQKLDVIS